VFSGSRCLPLVPHCGSSCGGDCRLAEAPPAGCTHGIRLAHRADSRRSMRRLCLLWRTAYVLRAVARRQSGQGGNAVFHIHFFLSLDADLTANFCGLHLNYFVAGESDKHHVLRRSAHKSILRIPCPCHPSRGLSLRRAVFRHDHHVMIHADQNFMPLHSFPNLGGEACQRTPRQQSSRKNPVPECSICFNSAPVISGTCFLNSSVTAAPVGCAWLGIDSTGTAAHTGNPQCAGTTWSSFSGHR